MNDHLELKYRLVNDHILKKFEYWPEEIQKKVYEPEYSEADEVDPTELDEISRKKKED